MLRTSWNHPSRTGACCRRRHAAWSPVLVPGAGRGDGPVAGVPARRLPSDRYRCFAPAEPPERRSSPDTTARTSGDGTSIRYAGSISVNRRSAVASAYARRYAPGLDQGTGYTGSDPAAGREHLLVLPRRHAARAELRAGPMNGLAPVRFSPTLNARSQRTALIMSANQRLSHSPPAAGAAGPHRRRQRRPVQPGTELPLDHLRGLVGSTARAGRRQRRRRPPALAAQPVQHHDGVRLDATPPTR